MEGAIREAVHRLKYSNLRAIAPALAGLLAEHLQAHPVPADLIVPVPLHPRRERQRGFNQAALLAKEAGRRLRLPLVERALARVRDSPPQARSASREERRANVQGAFMARQGFQGRCVLLVDDVCTTGATLEACAGALRNAGASSIWALTLAREP
ncbi:MAG: ComF family protein [Chloroflexi bacterium]|nr:ComF family protein [Chloroflexota bacterium]